MGSGVLAAAYQHDWRYCSHFVVELKVGKHSCLLEEQLEMTITPLALSLLGIETQSRRRHAERSRDSSDQETPLQHIPEARPSRTSRRATSHYNHFQTICSSANDDPPSYTAAIRHKPNHQQEAGPRREVLHKYECTVSAEAKVLLQLESISPLNGAAESEWREVYMVLRGTLLSFHRAKDSGPG